MISATDYYPFGMTMPGRGSSDLESAGTPENPTGRLRIEAESSTDRNGTQDEPSGDIGGTQNVIYVNPGNWLNYAVTAPVAGTYVLSLRASNGGSTAGLQVRNSSGTVLATVSIPNTGGWQQYATVTTSVILPAGAQTLQLYCSTNNWNLNWWELVPPGTNSGRRTAAGSFLVEAEDYIAQNSIITEASSDVSGTLNTVHNVVGSWADYRITVPVAGTYTVKLRAGSTGSGILKLRNAVGADLATLNLASTGGLQQYTTVEASVLLSGGTQTLRLYTEGASFTVNRLEIVTPPGTNNYALQLNNHPANGGGFISDAVNDFTVEFWIKAAGTHQIDVESNSLSNVEGVAGQRYAMFPVHGGGSGDAGMGVSVGTNGVSVYEHADGYMPPLLVWESSTPLADWTHVAIVYRNRQPSLYINGNWVKDGQVSQKNNVYAGLQFPGGHYGGTGGEQMDEVRVWKYARTEQQIRDNRQGEILGTTAGLAGYWPMNEGSGTVLHDISGNGRDIDLSSAGYNNSNWVSGRYTISNQEDLYRYAFNGQERSTEVGDDNYTAEFWEYDSRIGRRWNVDPIYKNSPYECFANNPILLTDVSGADTIRFNRATTIIAPATNFSGGGQPRSSSTNFSINVIKANGKDVYEFINIVTQIGFSGKENTTTTTKILNPFDRDSRNGATKGLNLYFDGLFTTQRDNADWESIGKFMNLDNGFNQYMQSRTPEAQKWYSMAVGIDAMEQSLPMLVQSGLGSYIGFYARFAKAPFTIPEGKYNYFFGRVTTGPVHNVERSAQNLKDLTMLGISNNRDITLKIYDAFNQGVVKSIKSTKFGTTITKGVNIGSKGRIDVGFYYQGGNMSVTPSVSSIIPKIY